MSNVAELVGISKVFGHREVLHDVSLSIRSGEILCLVGPNGAGKTTLTKILATLLRPSSGRVSICGVDAVADPVSARTTLAIVPQGVTPDPYVTPFEHVYYFLRATGVPRDVARERTESVLTVLGLCDFRDVRSQNLSGGYRRRVILAMALAARPRLLLLDEPTTALDPEARRQTWDRLVEIRDRTSILITTHDLLEAQVLSDRVALLADGRVVDVDTVPALLRMLPSSEKLVIDDASAVGLDLNRYGLTMRVAGRTVVYPASSAAAAALAEALLASDVPFSSQPTDLEDCYFLLISKRGVVVAAASR